MPFNHLYQSSTYVVRPNSYTLACFGHIQPHSKYFYLLSIAHLFLIAICLVFKLWISRLSYPLPSLNLDCIHIQSIYPRYPWIYPPSQLWLLFHSLTTRDDPQSFPPLLSSLTSNCRSSVLTQPPRWLFKALRSSGDTRTPSDPYTPQTTFD